MRPIFDSKVVTHPKFGEALTRQHYRELLARIEAQKEADRRNYAPLTTKEPTHV